MCTLKTGKIDSSKPKLDCGIYLEINKAIIAK